MDNDRNGRNEQINVTAKLQYPSDYTILREVQVLSAFNYELQGMPVEMTMEGLAYVSESLDLSLPVKQLKTQGHLRLKQSYPIFSTYGDFAR